jgi:hypothetical protein
VKLSGVLLLVLSSVTAVTATSIRFPKFSKPVLHNQRLVFTSSDSKRILCIALDGQKMWEQVYPYAVNLFHDRDGAPLMQTGIVVNVISPQLGELTRRFSVEDENDLVSHSSILDAFVSRDRRFAERRFKIIDEKTGIPIWTTTEIEDVVCATPQVIVALCGKRIPTGPGHRFAEMFLCAFDRKTFKPVWHVALDTEQNSPWLTAAFKPPYLAYADGRSALTVLDCTSGRKHVTKQMDVPQYGWISDVEIHGEQLVWLTSKLHSGDFNQREHLLHFCTIPELAVQKVIALRLIEIARVSFEGGFIISDALYRTACFREDGERLWSRFQSARTPVIDNRIYLSDYTNNTTRILVVDVPTGKETIRRVEAKRARL